MTQPAFTCLKLTIEALEQDVKYIQIWQWTHQNDAIWRRSGILIVNFEHI